MDVVFGTNSDTYQYSSLITFTVKKRSELVAKGIINDTDVHRQLSRNPRVDWEAIVREKEAHDIMRQFFIPREEDYNCFASLVLVHIGESLRLHGCADVLALHEKGDPRPKPDNGYLLLGWLLNLRMCQWTPTFQWKHHLMNLLLNQQNN